ncbi:MAG TPA: adenylate/guanylate cyclase domain-containing protein [Stellaceae bacterium]
MPQRSVSEWLSLVRAEEREGELFRAYDLAMQGVAQHPSDLTLKHRAVLCLAATGATPQAKAKYAELGLEQVSEAAFAEVPRRVVMDVATLRARLAKDEALKAVGGERQSLLAKAADLYEAIHRDEIDADNPEAYYPAVNAATLRLLTGRRAAAARLARAALDRLNAIPADRHGYYEHVSAVEAHLVLDEPEPAREVLAAARASKNWTTEADFRALASTLRQLRLVIDENNLDSTLLEAIELPRVIHYVGHIISPPGKSGRFPADQEVAVRERIDEALRASMIGFGYGSLAAGSDILFAEALLRRGASLHIVLPFSEAEFIDVSVRPAGADWVERYHACRARATTVRLATEDRYLGDDRLFGYCSQMAMGLALLRARHLATEAQQIAVWDGQPARGAAGTAADFAVWQRTGKQQHIIPCGESPAHAPVTSRDDEAPGGRRTRAMLFADVKGFSKLSDAELPRYTKLVLGAFARVIDRYGSDVLLANTWGDGVFLVFDDAGKAASCALELQEAMASIDLITAGLPLHLSLRIGGHLGPVYADHDPVLKKQNFFGAHVSRAARIEPVTPEGCVYVTETMAAVLAIHNADRFACDYVGFTEAAKHYGRLRMFLLRHAGR